MTNEQTVKTLIEKLADESRRNRNSAIAFCLIGLMIQIIIILTLGLPTLKTFLVFAVVSLIFAWIPFFAGLFYLRQSRKKAAQPENLLWRALTSEPQLIREIILDIPLTETSGQRDAEVFGNERLNVVGNILDGILGGNATPDYAIHNSSVAPLPPSVFVKLSDGANYRVATPLDAAETVAVLKTHAPHAQFIKKNQN